MGNPIIIDSAYAAELELFRGIGYYSSITIQGTKTKTVKVHAMQKCEHSKECEIRCSSSEQLLLGMPRPSHITWTLFGKSKNTHAS